MASPTFNGNKIFDSLDSSGASFSEGNLRVAFADPIIQTIHFEGLIGNTVLSHGTGDQEWEFVGYLSATTNTAFWTLINAIQTQIANFVSAPSTYHSLTDSFGNSYSNAQVRHMYPFETHTRAGGGLVASIRVTGVCQGRTNYSGT